MVAKRTFERIGIPRSILHYEFDGAIARFLERLDVRIVLSPATNGSIFQRGKRLVLDELCYPIKVYVGHVATLAQMDVDRILIPVLVGHENNRVFPCHPRTRLADIVSALGVCEKERILAPSFRFDAQGLSPQGFETLGETLGFTQHEVQKALVDLSPKSFKPAASACGDRGLTLAVLGHPYVVRDPWVNGYLIERLQGLGCRVLHERESLAFDYSPEGTGLHFDLAVRTMTMAKQWDRDSEVDGIVFLLPFNCGPDGDIARHLLQTTRTPILTLVLDELQSGAGVLTRLEAFVDLLSQSLITAGGRQA